MLKYDLHAPAIIIPESRAAYLAGIFDGEGNLYGQKGRIWRRWQLLIANTDQTLMAWLATLGGRVHVTGMPGVNKRTKVSYAWRVTASLDVLRVLESMEPFLIVKKAIAREAIQDIKSHLFHPTLRIQTITRRDPQGRIVERFIGSLPKLS